MPELPKRVRCDINHNEERRTCNRCLRAGSKCIWSERSTFTAGYADSFHAFSIGKNNEPPSESLPKYETRVQELLGAERISRIRNYQTILKPTTLISFQSPGNESERQLFHYFRLEAAPDICGHSNLEFWDSLILSWSHSEPVLRLAVVAFASFHKSFIFKSDSISYSSLQHYNKAIRAVQNLLQDHKKPSLQIVLSCCLLFYKIEGIRVNYEDRRKHLQAGLKIIQKATKGALDAIEPAIIETFSSLDVTASWYSKSSPTPCLLVLTTESERLGLGPCVPTTFTSVREASSAALKLANWAIQLFNTPNSNNSISMETKKQEAHHLRIAYERWEVAFSPLKQQYLGSSTISHLSETISAISTYVGLTAAKTYVFSQSAVFAPPTVNIRINTSYNKILLLVETLISIYNNQEPEILHPRSFFFIPNVVSMTVLVAMNTQDSATLDRALRVMRQWPKIKGIYDGDLGVVVSDMEPLKLATRTAILDGPLSDTSIEFLEDSGRMKLLDESLMKRRDELTRGTL
ncbi:hypothetical protein HYFRA_00004267 [Hymenoscyphus fraxineus]|uniref:Zn(2)-C6 fungal-type domain-containing protein n=1 Tax=Hymenoscyphus fraxineus TaxID=746836 RepID=A0A9N9KMZ3_9HELO|nr:hypothetical protein HYFRA_00004267 [Hymenoscyphus fraxineus]